MSDKTRREGDTSRWSRGERRRGCCGSPFRSLSLSFALWDSFSSEFDRILEGRVRIAALQSRENRETDVGGIEADFLGGVAFLLRHRVDERQKRVILADLHAVLFEFGGLFDGESVGMDEQKSLVLCHDAVGVDERIVLDVAAAHVEQPADVVEFGEEQNRSITCRHGFAHARKLVKCGESCGLGGEKGNGGVRKVCNEKQTNKAKYGDGPTRAGR